VLVVDLTDNFGIITIDLNKLSTEVTIENIRTAGLLLHPTSFPSGQIGQDAFRFVDFLAACKINIWQVLPLGPTLGDASPYQSPSVHAGNPALICPKLIQQQGWLAEDEIDQDIRVIFKTAYQGFLDKNNRQEHAEFQSFCEDHQYWLDDYAFYCTLKEKNECQAWWQWSDDEKDNTDGIRRKLLKESAFLVDSHRFQQFVFFNQWLSVKQYANQCGVKIVGDIPIFVAHDSAEVWANRRCFDLDEEGLTRVVAGVPPDYFSATGQRWGNPHYNWRYIKQTKFQWWIDRIRTQHELFDIIRIDHFRGFESYWEIPAAEETAINGRWVTAPGKELFQALRKEFGDVPLLAEDLGIITPEVEALRDEFNFPGMKILQFAFGSGDNNQYLPHNYVNNCVVYTGTHDNDTTLGWYHSIDSNTRHHVDDYVGGCVADQPWPLIRLALASSASYAIIPMQDILGLGSVHRMNTPGTTEGNWAWSYTWDQLYEGLSERIAGMVKLYGRG
jgi:4-alpha-glucanotransferase